MNDRLDRLLPIPQLQLFDALYGTRNVSRAAEHLQVSQPTASAWLIKLRRHFQDQLFIRNGGSMNPTPRADELAPVVREAIEALRTLGSISDTFDPAVSRRAFRLQCPDGTHLTVLPGLLRAFAQTAPNIQLNVSSLSANPEDDLRSDRTDLIITLASAALQQEFRARALVEQGWLCLTRLCHPITELRVDQYRTAQHIEITNTGWSRILRDRLAGETWRRQVTLTTPGVLGLPEILAETDLIVTLPENIARALSNDPRLTLTQARSRSHPSPSACSGPTATTPTPATAGFAA